MIDALAATTLDAMVLRDGKVVTAPAEWTGGQGVGPSKPPEEPSVPAHEAVLLDALADADLTSADLTLALNEKSPGLSDAVLLAMLNREPPMTGNDMKVVLLNNFPSDAVLLEMIASSKMSAQNKQPPLFAFSPLDPVVLQAALDMSPGLPPGQVNALLNQQTP